MDSINVSRRDLLRLAGGGIGVAALGISGSNALLAQEGTATTTATGSPSRWTNSPASAE